MMPLQDLVLMAKNRAASDVLVMVGDTPAMRIAGGWVRYDHPRCTNEDLEKTIKELLRPDAWDELQKKRDLDFSCTFGKTGRVRCNAHYQRDNLALVLRLVWPTIPDSKTLGIPNHVVSIGDMPHGLVLVSGPTGCGKSTTLAAIVEYINKHRPGVM